MNPYKFEERLSLLVVFLGLIAFVAALVFN